MICTGITSLIKRHFSHGQLEMPNLVQSDGATKIKISWLFFNMEKLGKGILDTENMYFGVGE